MTTTEILWIVQMETGVAFSEMVKAKNGNAYHAKLIAVIIMHEEGMMLTEIAKLFGKDVNVIRANIVRMDVLLSAGKWSPEYNKWLKSNYLGCIKQIVGTEDSSDYGQPHSFDVKPQISSDTIINIVCDELNVNTSDVTSADRHEDVALARHICIYFINQLIPAITLKKIGAIFNGRNHSTILNSCKVVQGRLDTNPLFRSTYKKLIERITEAGRVAA